MAVTNEGVSETLIAGLELVRGTRAYQQKATALRGKLDLDIDLGVSREAAVGVDERRRRLARYATWTQEDLEEFNEALVAQRSIDDPLWR